ncbi:MAG: DEAD/DEAH box helicase, partial [Ornithinimicrobium sp.]
MLTPPPFDPVTTLAHLARGGRSRALVHTHTVPARSAVDVDFPEWVDPSVYAAITGSGVRSLWSHQAEMAQSLRSGEHTVLATGTASGKSLGYLVPVLSSLMEGTTAATGRGSSAIYLAPTKALAADQEARLSALALPELRCATYDGDTPSEERRWIRDHAHYVLTNPDLLHHSLLPGHEHWRTFLRKLTYVVVDECHVYRGVFGAHVSAVLRRLLRVAARYGARPTVAFASATVAQPAQHASALIGQPVCAITADASPRD